MNAYIYSIAEKDNQILILNTKIDHLEKERNSFFIEKDKEINKLKDTIENQNDQIARLHKAIKLETQNTKTQNSSLFNKKEDIKDFESKLHCKDIIITELTTKKCILEQIVKNKKDMVILEFLSIYN